jgi:hypothetical protein
MKYYIVLEAVSPIAHGDTLTGVDNGSNIRLFMRTPVIVDGRKKRIPTLSENSLRTVLFRKPLADDLLMSLGIQKDEPPKSVLNLLFSGGNLGKGAKAPGDQFALGKLVQSTYPMLELVSGCVDNFVLPQSRLRPTVWPLAQEFANSLKLVKAPKATIEKSKENSIYKLVDNEVRTRGTGEESDGNQMLYEYEVMAIGTQFYLELNLDCNTSELAASAMAYALEKWDGYFGGQGRQGRGRMVAIDSNLPNPRFYSDWLNKVANDVDSKTKSGIIDGTLGTTKILCEVK